MLCVDAREAISARLDDEVPADEVEALDAHLGGCGDCRRYADRAAHVTRLTRTRVAEPGPDLVAAVLAAAPPPRRRGGGVRLGLGAVGLGQCALAISGIVDAGAAHGGSAGTEHMSHESAAWNLALAVGFLWVATGAARRTSGLVALVGAFVGVLAVLSGLDLLDGRVEPARLATHLLVVVGFGLLLALRRVDRRDGGGTQALHAPAHRSAATGPDAPAGGPGLAPTARAA